jgi:hypothetical protein
MDCSCEAIKFLVLNELSSFVSFVSANVGQHHFLTSSVDFI